MLKNKIWFGIILSVILLAFSINGFTSYYKYTQEAGANFYVGTGDKADALEDTNQLRQIIDDLGALLVHSKRNDLYPKDNTTGGTIQIPEAGLKFSNAPVNNDIAAYIAGEMAWQTKAELGLDLSLYYLKTAIDTQGEVETIWGVTLSTDAERNALTYSDVGAEQADAGLTSLAGLTYVSPSFIKVTATDTYAIRTITETKTDLSLNNVTNDAQIAKSIGTAQGDIIYFTASSTPTVLPKGTALQVLTMNAGATAPEWAAGGDGYTNLTSFVDQTAWRLFYSNNLGDVIELALGTDGQYLKSTGATSAPVFDTPGGAGDMLKATYDADEDNEIDVAGGGTEKDSWTQYCIPYLSGTTAFGEIPIGTDNYALTVNGATGYDWTHLQVYDAGLLSLAGLTYVSDSFIKVTATDTYAIRTIAEMKTDLAYMTDLVDDTGPDLGGEMDAGAHTIGFTLQSTTGDGTTTIDWKLGNKFKFTFGAQNETFTFTAPTNPCTLMLTIIQDGTGSRTITWPATVKWPGGTAPTLTTTANARDKVALDWDGTQYDGVVSLDFK